MQAFESEEKKYIPKQAQLSVTQPSLLMTSRPGTVSYFSKPSTYSINKKQFYRKFLLSGFVTNDALKRAEKIY